MNIQIRKIEEENIDINNFKKFLILKIFVLIFIILYEILIFQYYCNKRRTFEFLIEHQFYDNLINKTIDLDYENVNFIVIKRTSCPICGLLSIYIVYLGCIRKYLIQGFIPILELESYENAINGFRVNPSKGNPWEYFFNQPFGYKYKDVIKKTRNIKYIECTGYEIRPNEDLFLKNLSNNYWHIMANKYIPIKNKIIRESNNIIQNIFKGSKNVLGVLLRGTDYIAKKPPDHPIPPKTEEVIKDVKLLNNKNRYDWIFLATEDIIIRREFIRAIGIKAKYLLNKREVLYNYTSKEYLAYNENIKNNIEFHKIYLLNIIILSKCLDFLGAKTNGTIGVFILTNGFRNYKVYNLGHYT
jgi:hypothetical protein